jgi:hypothetical protein
VTFSAKFEQTFIPVSILSKNNISVEWWMGLTGRGSALDVQFNVWYYKSLACKPLPQNQALVSKMCR